MATFEMKEVFNLVLETTPTYFLNWIVNKIPQINYDSYLWGNETKKEYEPGDFSVGGYYEPPDDDHPAYRYSIDIKIYDAEEKWVHIGNAAEVEVLEVRDGWIQAICRCNDQPDLLVFLRNLLIDIERIFQSRNVENYGKFGKNPEIAESKIQTEPQMLEKPKEPDEKSLKAWFVWRQNCLDHGYKCTLREIAVKAGYSISYVKQMHARYKAEQKPEPKNT